jgi:hypothetical protein
MHARVYLLFHKNAAVIALGLNPSSLELLFSSESKVTVLPLPPPSMQETSLPFFDVTKIFLPEIALEIQFKFAAQIILGRTTRTVWN